MEKNKNNKENLIYIITGIATIIVCGLIIFFFYNLHKDDNVYLYLQGENDRVRTSVELYYLTPDEKEIIYNELNSIDKSILDKESQIAIDNKIQEVHDNLIIMEKNNIKEIY